MNTRDLFEFALLAFGSLFVIVDPIATVPAFVAMTPDDTPAQRIKTARLACIVAACVLLAFALGGRFIFKFFGITIPAFQIAASIVLMMVALDMLRAQRSRVQETREETSEGATKDDIAVTPLAIPMLAGPGAISTAIVLQSQAVGITKHAILCGCIVAVAFVSYLIFRVSARSTRWLSPLAVKIATRIMGLLLVAIAVQFLINGLKGLRPEFFPVPPV